MNSARILAQFLFIYNFNMLMWTSVVRLCECKFTTSICQSWKQCRPWWIIWFQLRGVSRNVTGPKITALPYNLINILVPVSINSLLYSGILLKRNLIMITAEEIDYFVFHSVHKCLFKTKLYFFLSKNIFKGVLGCPGVSSSVLG